MDKQNSLADVEAQLKQVSDMVTGAQQQIAYLQDELRKAQDDKGGCVIS